MRNRIIFAILCGSIWSALFLSHGPNENPTMYFSWFDLAQVGAIVAVSLYSAWRAGAEHERDKEADDE